MAVNQPAGETPPFSARKALLPALLIAVSLLPPSQFLPEESALPGMSLFLLKSAQNIIAFVKQIHFQSGFFSQFADEKIVPYFPSYNRFLYEHPAVTRAVGAFTLALFGNPQNELFAYRMGNALLVSCAMALVVLVISWRFQNIWIGLLTSIVCFTMPRVFGQIQIGDTDTALYALSFPTAMAGYFAANRESPRWAFLCSVLCGVCIATKFTGLIVILGIFVWTFLYHRDKKVSYTFFFIPLIAPIVFILLNPAYWHDPLLRMLMFFARSSSRHLTEPHMGYMFDFFYNTPWYYPVVMILATIPLLHLGVIAFGLVKNLRDKFKDDLAGLFAILFALPILTLLAPGNPAYDGVRLFLISFLYLGLFSAWTFKHFEKWVNKKLVAAIVAIALVIPCVLAHPFELEYYAAQIGGATGASRLGLEMSYWWDAANPEFYEKANRFLTSSTKVALFPSDVAFREYYTQHHFLNGEIVEPAYSDQMVVLCRPSCDTPRLAEFVGQWYQQPRRILAYPSEKTPYVILLQR